MSSKKRGLGKGLNELLSATLGPSFSSPSKQLSSVSVVETPESQSKDQSLRYLNITKMVTSPFQPRLHIRSEELEELAESIRAQGLIQPIVVRKKEDDYEIIAGERRWRAAKLAGLELIPALVRDVPDNSAMAMALIENIQRKDLNPLEEATALKRLSDELHLTHLQVAEAVGKSRTSVTNLLRLLTLEPQVQILLKEGELEMGHARALLGLKGPVQLQIAQAVVTKNLSVRETERLVNKLQENSPSNTPKPLTVVDPNIRRLEEDLADKLGAQVVIRHGHKGRGMVVIRYHDVDELEGILAHIK